MPTDNNLVAVNFTSGKNKGKPVNQDVEDAFHALQKHGDYSGSPGLQ